MENNSKFNYRLLGLLRAIKKQTDAFPKFDPKLGILNVAHPNVAYFTAASLAKFKIHLSEINSYLEALKSLGAINSFEFDTRYSSYALKLPKQYEELFPSILHRLRTIEDGEANPVIQELYLDSKGHFWKEPKGQFNFKLKQNSDRYKIVKFLGEHTGYHPTDILNKIIDSTNKDSLYVQISSIRKRISQKLGIADEVIQNDDDSGYRNNPQYPIKLIP